MKLSRKVWIIIPARNEEKRILPVIRKTKKFADNVIVVDDGSNDSTRKILEKEDVLVLKHIVNMGKGAALKTGCDYAKKHGAEILVVMDADGQHKPEDVPKLVHTLEKNNLDIVFGSRQQNKRMPFIFRWGNQVLSRLTQGITKVKIQDTQCGFRAFTINAYRKIRWEATDYTIESEMVAKVGKNHLKYKEIPIQTIYLDKYKGTTIFHGLKIGFETLLWRIKG